MQKATTFELVLSMLRRRLISIITLLGCSHTSKPNKEQVRTSNIPSLIMSFCYHPRDLFLRVQLDLSVFAFRIREVCWIMDSMVCQQVGCADLISSSKDYFPIRQPVWELDTSCHRTGSSICESWTNGVLTSVLTVACSGTSKKFHFPELQSSKTNTNTSSMSTTVC